MNNLKRVLSLGLSGVMLAGLLTVGASAADFTDAEDIQHDEAVNVLVALKIIDGKPDGTFAPEENVSRAQMAKMIAVAMNGGNEPGANTTTDFTDVASNHWAASYIKYCADLGIISGRGDGTFDPEADVTAIEATKMVLTAMGFDATAYKLTGAQWATRTDEVARTMTGQKFATINGQQVRINEPNMYDELAGTAMSAPASRDTAAQLIWNGLQNRTRTVQPTTTASGGTEWTYITNSTTLLEQRYGATVDTGTFNGNYYTGNTTVKGEIEIAINNANGSTTDTDIPYDLDISNIGEEVKVIWKDGTRGTKNTLDSKDIIYGVFNTGATQVVTGTLADVKDQKNGKAQIDIGGTKYDLTTTGADGKTDTGVDVIVNYANNVARTGDTVLTANGKKNYQTADLSAKDDNSTLTKELKRSTGDTIKAVIDPDTNKITTIYVTTTKLAAVTAVNSEKVTMNNNVGAIKIADNDVEEGLKKGDVVAVTVLYKAKATDDDAFTIVKKAETVEGEVDGWKESKTVTVDGTAQKIYNENASFMLTGTAIPDEDNTITTFKDTGNTYIGEEVKLYMVNGYVGAAVQTSESASNYSLVTEVKDVTSGDSAFGGLELQVMDSEGVKSIIKVDKNSSAGNETANYKVGDIVTYTMTDDGTAKVSKEADVDVNSAAEYDKDTKTFGVTSSTLTLTATDCVLFVQTEKTGVDASGNPEAADMNGTNDAKIMKKAEYKAYSIRSLGDFTGSKGMSMVPNKDGKIVAAFVNLQSTPDGATDDTIYGIVSAENGRIKDYYSYTVQSNGEEYTVKVDSKTKTLSKGNLVYFDKSNDDTYSETGTGSVTEVKSANADTSVVWTKEPDDGTLTYYTGTVEQNGGFKGIGQKTLALEKDAPIVYVDTKNDKSEAEGSIGHFDTVTGYANAIIITDGKNPAKIKAVFVETSNEENINKETPTQGALSAAEIADMEDGTFVPGNKTALASSADADQLRVFKFTGDGTCTNVKLTIKDSDDKTVYTETGAVAKDTKGHYFWVAVGKLDVAGLGGTVAGSWQKDADNNNVTAAPAGSYTYTITGSSDASYGTTLSTGSFTIEK